MMENEGKLRLLYTAQILWRRTNEEHMLSTSQIIDILKNEYGISAHRITVTGDIEVLQEFGIDICKVESTQNKYFVASRIFQLPELRLLVDSVSASGAVTEKKSRSLMEKLALFTDDHTGKKLIFPKSESGNKPENEKIYYIIDKINEGIEQDKKICFYYFSYDENKQQKLKNHGEEYRFSPYALEVREDHYYAVGFCEKHNAVVNFRVDRIATVPTVTDDVRHPLPEGFDISAHLKTSFRMFAGETEKVELLCCRSMMNTVIDHFGCDVEVETRPDCDFVVRTEVKVSPMFFRWIFGFDGKIKIISPESVKEKYGEMIRRAYDALQA